ncbi:MAG: ABC transporter ATP-binding protein [Sulfolobaceae archaeon]|nr:ABC transporter ATP-binding protein [Sulfolobaceae archaeon]
MSLNIENLNVRYTLNKSIVVKAVNNVSFTLEKGDSLGIIGETGSGKSTLASAILRALPTNGYVESGKITFDGIDILHMDPDKFRKEIRWKRISIIPQYSMNSFNPIKKVGDQLVTIIMEHTDNMTVHDAFEHVMKLFEELNLPPETFKKYPDELSGGQKQRAVIASALLLDPDMVIADEPTTALDVINQARVVALIKNRIIDKGKSLIYITHDIAVIAGIAKKVMTLYAGEIMELGEVHKIFKDPLHPYTIGLLNSVPDIRLGKVKKLSYIPGDPPDLTQTIKGCPFYPRCPIAKDICKEQKPQLRMVDGRFVACHFADKEVIKNV